MNAQIVGMLGLCARAGQMKTGEAMCEKLIKSGGALLAIVDAGASQRAKKDMRDACDYGQVPLVELPQGVLGQAIGKPGRMAVAITGEGFAIKLQALCAEPDNESD